MARQVLVAAGDPAGRRTLRQKLRTTGWSVDAVACGAEVLRRCGLEPPDVLILDADLPDFDVFELCERVRRGDAESAVTIVLLAEVDDDMTSHYADRMSDELGADYYLTKPFDVRLLIQLIGEPRRRPPSGGRRVRPTFPTRVTWPTSRLHLPVAAP